MVFVHLINSESLPLISQILLFLKDKTVDVSAACCAINLICRVVVATNRLFSGNLYLNCSREAIGVVVST